MVDNVIHYRYLNKPVVVATVDVPKDERVPSDKIVNFLVSEGIKFDYLAYDREKCRYYAMLNKKGFERSVTSFTKDCELQPKRRIV